VIVSVDVSQLLVDETTPFGSLGVNVALHDVDPLAFTVMVVAGVAPLLEANGAVLSVNVMAAVPEQLALVYRLKVTVPEAVPPAPRVTVAVSFGSHT